MNTPTITTTITAAALALAIGFASPALAQDEQDETSGEVAAESSAACSRWGFKKIALGMSVAQVKEHYAAAAADPSQEDAEKLGGRAYRWQHKDGAQLIDFRVLANGEGDDATVVQIRAKIHGGGITPAQWHSALLQKWGGIAELRENEPAAGQTTIDGRSVDDACDARVEFLGTGDSEEMSLEITLVSIAATRAWQMQQAEEANRNKARDLLE